MVQVIDAWLASSFPESNVGWSNVGPTGPNRNPDVGQTSANLHYCLGTLINWTNLSCYQLDLEQLEHNSVEF